MGKLCDNKSVGVIIRDNDTFAVIERKNFPVAYAFVAGHLDGDICEDAARKEANEEVGIRIDSLEKKLQEKYFNSCKREGGSWHEWCVYEATQWSGTLRAASDAATAQFMTLDELEKLEKRTEYISEKLGIPIDDLENSTPKFAEDPEWIEKPGLEPVWVVMLCKIGILN